MITWKSNAPVVRGRSKPLQLEELQFEPVGGRPYQDIQRLNEFEYGLWPSKYKQQSQRFQVVGPLGIRLAQASDRACQFATSPVSS
jgi:hypothetical protein